MTVSMTLAVAAGENPGDAAGEVRDGVDGSLRYAGPAEEVGLHAEIVEQNEGSSIALNEGGSARRVGRGGPNADGAG